MRVCYKSKGKGASTTVKLTIHTTKDKLGILFAQFLGGRSSKRLTVLSSVSRVGMLRLRGSCNFFGGLSRRGGRRMERACLRL